MRNRLLLAVLSAASLALAFAVAGADGASLDPWYLHSYGGGYFTGPRGVAVGPGGDVYVVNHDNFRIEKYSKDGTHLLGWGSFGAGPGEFQEPWGIAVGHTGDVFVTDIQVHRVQRFTPNGVFVSQIGSYGGGLGTFFQPHGVGVAPSGDIYVADTGNHTIQHFSPAGVFVGEWGETQGSAPGLVNFPYGIGVDASGNVYVADTYNHRIQKFSATGVFMRQWGSAGTGNGQFQYPNTVTIDRSGNVWVTDTNNHRVQRFTEQGVYVSQVGTQGSGPGQLWFPQGLGVSWGGDLHVANTNNNRIEVYRNRDISGHEVLLSWGSAGSGNGQFSDIRGIAYSPDGYVYVADKNGNRMQKFTSFGAWVLAWGTSGSGNGQFNGPTGVAVDGAGNVYVTDHLNSRVQKFTSSGTYISQWGSAGSGQGQFTGIWDIAVDAANNVYVVDANRIQKFTNTGTWLQQINVPNPAGICFDREGYLYVACPPDKVVRKFTPAGSLDWTWGAPGTGPGQFTGPADVVADSAGYVYVCDASNRIQQFTARGGYVAEWGETGSALRQLSAPQMMTVDPAGNVFVTEFGNYRVQKFASPPELLEVEDLAGDGGGYVRLWFSHSSSELGGTTPSTYDFHRNQISPPIWAYLGSVPVDGTTYSIVVPTPGDATPSTTGMWEYRVWGVIPVPNTFPVLSTRFGYSLNNVSETATTPVAGRSGFALEPVRPNPLRGAPLVVHLTLATAERARIAVTDVAGRMVAERTVSGVGAHVVNLQRGDPLAPGVYFVRAEQGAMSHTRRVVVLE